MSRSVLITGANRGIGLGLSVYFLKQGYDVIATARHPNHAEELNSLAKDYPGKCIVEACDVKSDSSVAALAAKVRSRPHLDILINNAGVLTNATQSFKELSLRDVEEMLLVNTVAAMRVTRALLPILEGSQRPFIANITSKMGSIADNTGGGYYGYRMSKAAMNMFNKSFAIDYPKIISVVFHPGWVQTDMGGENAPVTVEQSAQGLGQLIEKLDLRSSGKFLEFTGKEIPW